MRFADKTVIVTGGAAGIGRGCVNVFHAEGARVGIIDRDAEAAGQLADELNATRPESTFVAICDVAETDDLKAAVDGLAAKLGQLDCLINNAGAHPPATALEDFSAEQMQHLFQVNFLSTYVGCQAALPHLRKTKGTIVNMASMTAVLGQHLSTAYSATKGAQVSFTKALAIEAADDGIRVNAVLPSNVDTPLMHAWANTLDDPETALKRVAELQVLKRMASSEEIGRVCLFLATADSSFVTGQAIEADGGAALDY